MNSILYFYSKAPGMKVVRKVRVNAEMEHAKLIGQGLVGDISIELNQPVWLGLVKDDKENTHILPHPPTIRKGVELEVIFD